MLCAQEQTDNNPSRLGHADAMRKGRLSGSSSVSSLTGMGAQICRQMHDIAAV